MKIHKAGYGLIIKLFIVFAIVNAVVFVFVGNVLACRVVLGLSVVLYLLIVNFFRFPNRKIHLNNHAILCPADGKVVVVEETYEPEHLKRRCIQVSVFMSILNVHINWFPVNGRITYFRYHRGRYMAAYLPKSSTENERTTIGIQPKRGKEIVMRQIAGAMAKRIVTYAKVGGDARQDHHAGFIKFGSRVDLFLPLGTQIDVKVGQKVKGSQTIIGRFQEQESQRDSQK